ncbi:MAG: response regulator [Oligoflexia bacterium]|nr:response regulator [Oligoflexia bacterium]
MMFKNASILIVDDEAQVRTLLAEMLQVFGLPVYCARDGSQAAAILGQDDIAVALIDYKMPKINGIELLEYINDCCRFVVPIFMTGFADIRELTELISLGVFDFIEKPISASILQFRVEKAIEKYHRDKLAYLAMTEFIKDKLDIVLDPEVRLDSATLYSHVKEALTRIGYIF